MFEEIGASAKRIWYGTWEIISKSPMRSTLICIMLMMLIGLVVIAKMVEEAVVISDSGRKWERRLADHTPGEVPPDLISALKNQDLKIADDAKLLEAHETGVAAIVSESNGKKHLVRCHFDHICVNGELRDNAEVVGKVVFVIACIFTLIATLIQYIIKIDEDSEPASNFLGNLQMLALVGNLLILGAAVALACFAAERFNIFQPFSSEYLRLFFPTPKNLIAITIAALFLLPDFQLVNKQKAGEHIRSADLAVLFSLLASSIFLGWLSRETLSLEFVHAFNTGTVAFHMFLGVILAASGLSKSGPGVRQS